MQEISSIYEWHIQRFDYNKDISLSNLRGRPPLENMSWTSKGLLKIKYLGTIFQIYSKELPEKGANLRVEGHFSTGEKNNVIDTVEDMVLLSNSRSDLSNLKYENKRRKHPFTTAEEMLRDLRNKSNQ